MKRTDAGISRSFIVGGLVLALAAGCSSAPTPEIRNAKVSAYVHTAIKFMDTNGLRADSKEWKTARAQVLRDTQNDTALAQTYPALKSAVAVAGDPRHSMFQPPKKQSGTGSPAMPAQLPTAITASPGIAMITIPSHPAAGDIADDQYIAAALSAISTASGSATCGWIVDLRANQGGDLYPMLAALSPLLRQGHLVSYVNRTGNKSWVSFQGSDITYDSNSSSGSVSVPVPRGSSSQMGKPMAVLQSPATASSGEGAVLALLGQPSTRSFGQPTAGLATANVSTKLSDGAVLTVTSAWMSDLNGSTYATGIPPKQRTSTDQATMSAATTWLRSQCGNH